MSEFAALGKNFRLRDWYGSGWLLEHRAEGDHEWHPKGCYSTRRLLVQVAEGYGLDECGVSLLEQLPDFYKPDFLGVLPKWRDGEEVHDYAE